MTASAAADTQDGAIASAAADTQAGAAAQIGPGTRAIVTGASWGIGETFARTLAARGSDLLLVARTESRLNTLAASLRASYGVRVETVVCDLADLDGPRRVVEAADALGFAPTLLVNNAGVGVLGPFAELPLDRAREMVRLNTIALTDLTYRVLERMDGQSGGAILNVGSASAFQPLPHYGVYAATKAFVVSFSAALWAECRARGVRVVAVCPGPVDAGDVEAPHEADSTVGPAEATPPRRHLRRKVTREQVVQAALAAVEQDRPIVVTGGTPAVARLALGLLPRRSRLQLTGMLLRRYPSMLTGTRRRDPSAIAPSHEAQLAAVSQGV